MSGERPGAVQLVGRDAELAALDGVARALRAGRGRVVLIDGAAGTGKSSLLSELVVLVSAEGDQVRHGAATEPDRDLPFAVVERVLGVAPVRALSGDSAAPLTEGGLATVHTVARAAAELASAGPTLLAFDDLHWADDRSLQVIEALVRTASEQPLTVALAWRRADLADAHLRRLRELAGVVELSLSDLAEAESAEFVRACLPGADAVFAAAGHRVTGGNPLLLHELTTGFAATGQAPDRRAAERLIELTPASVRAAILARLGQLSDQAVSLASAVAVLGDGAALHHVAQVAKLDADAAAEVADRLVAVEVLTGERTLSFRHPVLAGAVLDDLGSFTRSQLYRRAAAVVAADGRFDLAGALLMRSTPGGDPMAVGHLRNAAASALGSGDGRTAIRLLQRALDEPARIEERPGLLVDLARAEAAVGEPASIDHLNEALRQIEEPAARARVLRSLARLHHARYAMPHAARLAERALTELGEDHPFRDRVLATWLLSAGLDPERQEQVRRLHLELADATGGGSPPTDPELQASLAMYLLFTGQSHTVAAELAERAVEADAILNDDGLGLASDYALHVLLAAGRLAAVVRCAGIAEETAEHHASVMGTAAAACWRAHARLGLGDLKGAIADALTGLVPATYGWPAHSTYAAGALALARLELGDLGAARDAIALIPELPIPDPPRSYFAGVVELGAGRPSAARRLFERAGAELLAVWGVDCPAVLPWRSGSALAALADRDLEAAEELSVAELHLARQGAVPLVIGRALRTRGLARGGVDGVEVLREACAALAGTEHLLDRLRCQVDLGSALRRAGARKEAREVLGAARARAEELGCSALSRRAADEQHASGGRPRRVPVSGAGSLTPSERRIAQLAAAGATNREIAAELFLTPKTVEWHLGHVFRKLDVSGRRHLGAALTDSER